MLEKTGMVTPDLLHEKLPGEERLQQGPVAVVECFQPIPCDPCVDACPRGAILPMESIIDLPRVDFAKCNGCGLCIFSCPGLAIFVVDENHTADLALVKMPYEFLPLPEEGEEGAACNRAGREICRGRIEKVQRSPRGNRMHVLWVAVPRQFAREVRFWKRKG